VGRSSDSPSESLVLSRQLQPWSKEPKGGANPASERPGTASDGPGGRIRVQCQLLHDLCPLRSTAAAALSGLERYPDSSGRPGGLLPQKHDSNLELWLRRRRPRRPPRPRRSKPLSKQVVTTPADDLVDALDAPGRFRVGPQCAHQQGPAKRWRRSERSAERGGGKAAKAPPGPGGAVGGHDSWLSCR
jgi:hypothetical protein